MISGGMPQSNDFNCIVALIAMLHAVEAVEGCAQEEARNLLFKQSPSGRALLVFVREELPSPCSGLCAWQTWCVRQHSFCCSHALMAQHAQPECLVTWLLLYDRHGWLHPCPPLEPETCVNGVVKPRGRANTLLKVLKWAGTMNSCAHCHQCAAVDATNVLCWMKGQGRTSISCHAYQGSANSQQTSYVVLFHSHHGNV